MRSCGNVNIPMAIKIKPQMVVEYQMRKKREKEELARIKAEQKAAAQEEALVSQESEEASEEMEP